MSKLYGDLLRRVPNACDPGHARAKRTRGNPAFRPGTTTESSAPLGRFVLHVKASGLSVVLPFWEDVRDLGGIDPDLQRVEQGDGVTLATEEELSP